MVQCLAFRVYGCRVCRHSEPSCKKGVGFEGVEFGEPLVWNE